MPLEDEDDSGQAVAESSSHPVSDSDAVAERRPIDTNSPPPVFHPLAYRGVVAEWPIERREQWGRRANALEENGLSWRDAETQAFVEVWNLIRQAQAEHSAAAELTAGIAERN
jgi:hypothetical protein